MPLAVGVGAQQSLVQRGNVVVALPVPVAEGRLEHCGPVEQFARLGQRDGRDSRVRFGPRGRSRPGPDRPRFAGLAELARHGREQDRPGCRDQFLPRGAARSGVAVERVQGAANVGGAVTPQRGQQPAQLPARIRRAHEAFQPGHRGSQLGVAVFVPQRREPAHHEFGAQPVPRRPGIEYRAAGTRQDGGRQHRAQIVGEAAEIAELDLGGDRGPDEAGPPRVAGRQVADRRPAASAGPARIGVVDPGRLGEQHFGPAWAGQDSSRPHEVPGQRRVVDFRAGGLPGEHPVCETGRYGEIPALAQPPPQRFRERGHGEPQALVALLPDGAVAHQLVE